MGIDFTAPALDELFFPVGSGPGALLPVVFNIEDDRIFEKDHSFTVTIISVEDNVVIKEPSNVTVTIEDDEGMTVCCIGRLLTSQLQHSSVCDLGG